MSTIAEAREQLKFSNYRKHLKIEDRRTGALVTFEPNSVQRKLRAEIVSQIRAGKPVRLWILKSRRMGISTMIQATFAHYAFTTQRFSAMTGAHEDDSSEHLHGMAEQMYEHLPEALKKTKRTGLRGKRLKFTDGSGLTTFTAMGGAGVGRGKGTRGVHASEVGYYRDPRSTLLALRQIVPFEPETFFIGESTAHGMGDEFQLEWDRAVAGESDYTALFYAWHEFEDYRMPVLVPLGELDAEEQELKRLGITDEQLAWRRHTIANECGGSLDLFHQEYPATPEQAFLTSGRTYFENLGRLVPEPAKLTGEILGKPVRGGSVRFSSLAAGPVQIWESPKAKAHYTMGADVAGSVIRAQYDSRPAGVKVDAYCAYVVETKTGRLVASFYARGLTEDQYALRLAQLGRLFNDAEIAVEKQGGYGTATIITLRQLYAYPHLYVHLDEDSTETGDETGAFGFPMSTTTRPIVLADLSSALADRPLALRDEALKREMARFIVDDAGRPAAGVGAHDDRVMAMAITQHVRNLRATRPLRVGSPPTPPKRKVQSLAARAPRLKETR